MTNRHFEIFKQAQKRPVIDQQQSTKALWTDPHIAQQMLTFHLDPTNDAASYRHEIIDSAVDWMVNHFDLHEGDTYLDLGCGPGIHTRRMAVRGLSVTGVDFSEYSIQYARKKAQEQNLTVDYRCQNYLDIDILNTFDLVSLISCDFCALIPEDRIVFLRNVYSVMKDTGIFYFDFHSKARLHQLHEFSSWTYHDNGGFYSEDSHLLLTNQFVFKEEGISCTKYTVIKGVYNTKELLLWHRYYDLNEVMSILLDAGLQVTEVYGRVDGKPFTGESLDITVAVKKSS